MLRQLGRRALDTLYPPRCVACASFGTFLCSRCRSLLRPAAGPGTCPNCGAAWQHDANCEACRWWDALDGSRAAFTMDGPARRAVHALKYLGARDIAPIMAEAVASVAPHQVDAVFPIPLHHRRHRRRGYNQADAILKHTAWPEAPGSLRRIRHTATQVGLSETERRRNVAGAFSYTGPELDGQRILLLDDVITTGATANECAAVLKDFGARHVIVVAFTRASPGHD